METWRIGLKHNAWATRALLETCRALGHDQFHRAFELGCGTLHNTLTHIIGAMSRWSDRIADAPLRPSPENASQLRTADALIPMLQTAARELESAVERITRDSRLDEMMDFYTADGAFLCRFHRATAVVHVTTHGMHHRAQALNMLRQLGVSPLPEIDTIDWELSAGEWQ